MQSWGWRFKLYYWQKKKKIWQKSLKSVRGNLESLRSVQILFCYDFNVQVIWIITNKISLFDKKNESAKGSLDLESSTILNWSYVNHMARILKRARERDYYYHFSWIWSSCHCIPNFNYSEIWIFVDQGFVILIGLDLATDVQDLNFLR